VSGSRLVSRQVAGGCAHHLSEKLPHGGQIAAVLQRLAPRSLCDSCVADHTGLVRAQVTAAIVRAADKSMLRRSDGRCSGCCTLRRVTREASYMAGAAEVRIRPQQPIRRPSPAERLPRRPDSDQR
jgi:hypothetical protein